MTKTQASAAIQALLDCDWKPKENPAPDVPSADKVPEGYFFIVDPTDNVEKFFRVQHGKENTKWAGYVFLHVQASDFLYPVKDRSHRESVFAEILKDPVKAMNEYGLRLGRCGVCNRTLTDRDSRLRGIGPICAAKLYSQPNEQELGILQQLGLVNGD